MVIHLMPYKVQSFALTDVGHVRSNNEDSWSQIPDENFFVLADGMGGHQAGEIASHEAVAILSRLVKEDKAKPLLSKSVDDIVDILRQAFYRVNAGVYTLSCQNEDWKGMGTTLCCLIIHPQGAICAHVGDSRIYRLRSQRLEQLTQDHSLLRELADLGQIEEDQTSGGLYRNILTRAIGTEPIVEPTVMVSDIAVGDAFLLCSDGLSDLLSKADIEKILNQGDDLEENAKKLIKVAKQRGGYDNITVVLVKVQEQYEAQDLS